MINRRRLQWVSAVSPNNETVLASLQVKMANYYANSAFYYEEIDSTNGNWVTHPLYKDILSRLGEKLDIVEVGCGAANILLHHPDLAPRYRGCEFSTQLIQENGSKYPAATFKQITGNRLPYADGSADVVFSVFVIEHTVYPHLFLSECLRLLRPGGTFILLCPDFLGKGMIPSQYLGYSYGTGREKMKRGRIIDAIITGIDSKVRIPGKCEKLKKAIGDSFAFYINLAPVCFEYPFAADHDATYLTYDKEIKNYLRNELNFESTLPAQDGIIYMVASKKDSTADARPN